MSLSVCDFEFKSIRKRPLEIMVRDRTGYPIREIHIAELEDGRRLKVYEKNGEYYPFKFRDSDLHRPHFKCNYYHPERESPGYNWLGFAITFILIFLIGFFLLVYIFFPRNYIANPQQKHPDHPYPLL